jgi:hypothetical protein
MKRIYTAVVMTVLIFGMAAFAPYSPISSNELQETNLTAPLLISPANGATLSPGSVTLTWNPVRGAACYHVQAGLGTNMNEQSNVIDRGCVTGTSYTFTASPGFIVYFPHLHWRVQARTTTDVNGTYGPWSEVWRINFAR